MISQILILRMKTKSDYKIPSEINSPLSSGLDNYFFSCNTLAVLVLVITGLLLITVTILGLLLGVSEQFSAEFLAAEVRSSSDFRFRFTPVGVATAPVGIWGRGLNDITVVGLAPPPATEVASKFKGRVKLSPVFLTLASFDLKKWGLFFLSINFLLLLLTDTVSSAISILDDFISGNVLPLLRLLVIGVSFSVSLFEEL